MTSFRPGHAGAHRKKLRRIGWEDIQRIHPPPMGRKKDTPDAEAAYLKLERERDAAYKELKARIEQFENRSRTVREPPSVSEPVSESENGTPRHNNAKPSDCTNCGRYSPVGNPDYPGLCAACIGKGGRRRRGELRLATHHVKLTGSWRIIGTRTLWIGRQREPRTAEC